MNSTIFSLKNDLIKEKFRGEYLLIQRDNFLVKTNLLEYNLLKAVDDVTQEIINRKRKVNERNKANNQMKLHSLTYDLNAGEVMFILRQNINYDEFGQTDKRNVLLNFLTNKDTLKIINNDNKIKHCGLSLKTNLAAC